MGFFWRRKDEGRRFAIEGDGNFFLGNQSLSFHSIQPGSLLPLDRQIMAHEVGFGSRATGPKKLGLRFESGLSIRPVDQSTG